MSKRSSSAVWEYYTVMRGKEEIAQCNACNCEIRRGASGSKGKSFSTKSLWGHLKSKNPVDYTTAEEIQSKDLENKNKKKKTDGERSDQLYTLTKASSSDSSKQITIEQTLMRNKKYETNHKDQIEGEKLLVYWLCDGLKAYQTVGNERFIKFIAHLNKRFDVPSEKVIRSKLVPELNEKVQFFVKELLSQNKNGHYSITTDIWSSPSRDSFMSVTLHFITKEFERKVVILRCIRYNTNHTAVNLSKTLKGICNDWGIENLHAILRDNASNIVQGVKLAGFESMGCFCHILHLVVKHSVMEQPGVKSMINKVRGLVKKFQRPKGKSIFQKYQEKAGVPRNVMILDCKTRWGSTYEMCERTLSQKHAIKLAEDDVDLDIRATAKMTPTDWELIPKVLAVLGPLHKISKLAEGDSASISDVIPLTKRLTVEISSVPGSGIGTLKEKVLHHIERYLGGKDSRSHFIAVENNHLTMIATLLDPRYKTAGFMDKEKANRAKEKLLSLMISTISKTVEIPQDNIQAESPEPDMGIQAEVIETSPQTLRCPWDDILKSDSEDSHASLGVSLDATETAALELNKYMKAKRIAISGDALSYWKNNQNELPTLANLARKYLCPPPSSTTSEREFKIGKLIQKERIRLLPNNVEMLLFLKFNLRAINYDTSLPNPPITFKCPNDKVYDYDSDDDVYDEIDDDDDEDSVESINIDED